MSRRLEQARRKPPTKRPRGLHLEWTTPAWSTTSEPVTEWEFTPLTPERVAGAFDVPSYLAMSSLSFGFRTAPTYTRRQRLEHRAWAAWGRLLDVWHAARGESL